MPCGNWKNKGSAVCHSNMIRVEKANGFVHRRMEEVFSRVSREHKIIKKNASKEQELQEKERERHSKRIMKNQEAYEDDMITKDEFLMRKQELDRQMEQVRERTSENHLILLEEGRKEIPKEAVREILKNFSDALSADIDRTIRKRLLHLLIKEITIDRDRNIDSIKLKLSDELIRFLQNSGGTPPDGAPSVFMFQEFGIKSLELELVI